MEIAEAKKGNVMVVEIVGRVDSTNADVLQTRLLKLAETETIVLIDCQRLDYISSAGLGALLHLLKTLQKKAGRCLLCGLGASIREVFDISGFSKLFPILATQEEALREAGRDSPCQK